MRRRDALAALVGLAAAASSPVAGAQVRGTALRVGILSVDSPAIAEVIVSRFAGRLKELGWQMDGNLRLDLRRADAIAGLKEQAARLVASKPDVLVGVGPYAAASLKAETPSIPIVFVAVSNPVMTGLVASLGRPGGNVTGVSHAGGVGLGGKNAEILKELMPQAQRFAILINPDNEGWRIEGNLRKYLAYVGSSLKVSAIAVEARRADDLPQAMEAAVRARADGLVVVADSMLDSHFDQIVKLAARRKLPTSYPYAHMVEVGGLVSYSADMPAVLRRGADYVDRVLKGANPADLPVEQPKNYELTVNLRTARAMSLAVPQSVLLRASRVIE